MKVYFFFNVDYEIFNNIRMSRKKLVRIERFSYNSRSINLKHLERRFIIY